MTLRELSPFRRKGVPIKRETNPFALLRKEVDSLFEEFFRGFDLDQFWSGRRSSFSPRIDVSETDKEIKVTAELPGMDEKDIEVTLDRDTLTISGEKKEEKEDSGKDYDCMERSYGSFTRSIPLPVEVDIDKAEASYKKGILTVRIPKTAKAIEEKKKIQVKAE